LVPNLHARDDVLHFRSDAVRIHMTVRYSDYRRFRVSMRLVPTPQNPPPNAQPPPQNP
jgi:hypothetical protein